MSEHEKAVVEVHYSEYLTSESLLLAHRLYITKLICSKVFFFTEHLIPAGDSVFEGTSASLPK